MVEAIPDSTSNTQPNIGHTNSIQVSGACDADDQMRVEDIDPNSCRNISMWIGNEKVIIAGTKMSELILIHIAEINMKYKCLRCDYISYNVMNTYAHVGYVHMGTYCAACDTICFGACPGTKSNGTTHPSVSPPSASSSFHSFLGDFHPRTAIEQDLDYVIRVSEKGVEGMWVCIVC